MFECKICGKQCKNPNALRWHFDKCQRNSQKDSQTIEESSSSNTIEKKSFWDTNIFSGWFG